MGLFSLVPFCPSPLVPFFPSIEGTEATVTVRGFEVLRAGD